MNRIINKRKVIVEKDKSEDEKRVSAKTQILWHGKNCFRSIQAPCFSL